VTPGVAPENKLANRLANEGELSDDPTLEASEQPDNIATLTISAAVRRGPRRAKSKRSCSELDPTGCARIARHSARRWAP
jgi:hypothetical protein